MALAAIGGRRAGPSRPRPTRTKPKKKPLFEDDDVPVVQNQAEEEYSDSDPELALAIQASLDQTRSDSGSQTPFSPKVAKRSFDDDGDIYASPTRLETALAIAGAGPGPRVLTSSSPSAFGRPTLLTGNHSGSTSQTVRNVSTSPSVRLQTRVESLPQSPSSAPVAIPSPGTRLVRESGHLEKDAAMLAESSSSDDDMEEILPNEISTTSGNNSKLEVGMEILHTVTSSQSIDVNNQGQVSSSQITTLRSRSGSSASRQQDASPAKEDKLVPITATADGRETSVVPHLPSGDRPVQLSPAPRPHEANPESEGEGDAISDWSRSPSPVIGLSHRGNMTPRQSSTVPETWDAAQEMDPHAEEGEFARFVSQVKGRDLDDVRAEIDQEIKSLHQRKKAAMRDSDDITQQMISQIMVCQFVILF